jgi:quercetin dioxygenase-like cupin family protein
MKLIKGMKSLTFALLLSSLPIINIAFANDANQTDAVVTSQIFEQVKQNNNWKLAFLTAKDAQIVFMNVTPNTNPNNEIGMETHKFDQIIFVVEGNGKAILSGKATMVKPGDMIFIPQGVEHNVINLNAKKPLKILSVYSATDIPAKSAYQKKSDVPQE